MLEKMGAIDRWSQFRERWFVPKRGRPGAASLWPVALLFPAAVPLGLGQVFERLEAALATCCWTRHFWNGCRCAMWNCSPWCRGRAGLRHAGGADPLPARVLHHSRRVTACRVRAGCMAAGICATALSAALSYGPAHAWAWFNLPVKVGLGLAAMLIMLLLTVRAASVRPDAAGAGIYLSVINQAPTSAYFAHTCTPGNRGASSAFTGWSSGWLAVALHALLYVLTRVWGQHR